jgi:hypothetical protein
MARAVLLLVLVLAVGMGAQFIPLSDGGWSEVSTRLIKVDGLIPAGSADRAGHQVAPQSSVTLATPEPRPSPAPPAPSAQRDVRTFTFATPAEASVSSRPAEAVATPAPQSAGILVPGIIDRARSEASANAAANGDAARVVLQSGEGASPASASSDSESAMSSIPGPVHSVAKRRLASPDSVQRAPSARRAAGPGWKPWNGNGM